MAAEIIENIYLVNAPAGSGKTTTIRKMVEEHLIKNPQDNILCITYTNRAAEELGKNIDSKNIYFGTIHSYINSFLKSFFSHKEIIELYWEEYGDAIVKRINNVAQDQHISESNQKFKEKHGSLSVEKVKENINKISYTEAPFNSLYSGGLGHDDLIKFTRKVTDRFPIVRKKISDKYQLVFIDEYQDTNADVLWMFFSAMKNSAGRLYLLGDKMQQIYDNYDGSFEREFSILNHSFNLNTNYRATPKLVSLLNKIYNDETYVQVPYDCNSDDTMDYMPEVIITNNTESIIKAKQENFSDMLVLYLLNKSRFKEINALNLYDAVGKIDDYKFGGKYGVVEVLTTNDETNPDRLFLILFLIGIVSELYRQKKFGKLLRYIKRNKKVFNSAKCVITHHENKEIVNQLLEQVVDCYESDKTISDVLNDIIELEFMNVEYINDVYQDAKYSDVMAVSISEFRALYEYLHIQNVSTQHGVKGESHNSVIFVADDSNNPSVKMNDFFKLWSQQELTLKDIESFSYSYSKMIKKMETIIGEKVTAQLYKEKKDDLEQIINDFAYDNADNELFKSVCKNDWDAYNFKSSVTNFNKVEKKNRVKSLLMAYRLFYVGCSRARKNLTILVDKTKVLPFLDDLKKKFEDVGFNVIVE